MSSAVEDLVTVDVQMQSVPMTPGPTARPEWLCPAVYLDAVKCCADATEVDDVGGHVRLGWRAALGCLLGTPYLDHWPPQARVALARSLVGPCNHALRRCFEMRCTETETIKVAVAEQCVLTMAHKLTPWAACVAPPWLAPLALMLGRDIETIRFNARGDGTLPWAERRPLVLATWKDGKHAAVTDVDQGVRALARELWAVRRR